MEVADVGVMMATSFLLPTTKEGIGIRTNPERRNQSKSYLHIEVGIRIPDLNTEQFEYVRHLSINITEGSALC